MFNAPKAVSNAFLQCPFDSYGYPNSDFLHNHLIYVHTLRISKLIRCIKCKKLFTDVPALIRHRKVCTFNKNKDYKNILENGSAREFNFKCLKCGLSFNGLKKLADHFCGEKVEELNSSLCKKVQCSVCKSFFANQKFLDHHKLFHGFPKRYLTEAIILQLGSISYKTMKAVRITLNNILQCSICRNQFDDFENLIYHIKTEHEKDYNYNRLINLDEIEPYNTCEFAVVKHKSGRLKIIEENKIPLATKIINPKSGVFLCNLCKKVCLSMQFAVNHMLRHKIYIEQITNTITESDQVIITKELSIDIGRFKCTNCEVFFKSQIDLDAHLIRNHPTLEIVEIKTEFFEDDEIPTIPEYLSDDEDIVMNFVSELTEFKNEAIIAEPEELQKKSKFIDTCLICGSSFYSKQIFNDHVKRHRLPEDTPEVIKAEEISIVPEINKCIMKDGKFECSICRCVLPNLLEMQGHMRCHSLRPITERMFQCFACDKEFVKELQLKSHARTVHGTETSLGFKCDKCDKIFYLRHKLTAHRRHHLMMENPHQLPKSWNCSFCERTFKAKSISFLFFSRKNNILICFLSVLLEAHEAIHTNTKPFKCKLCDLSFSIPKHRSDHYKFDHLKQAGLTCEMCGKVFREPYTFAKHLTTHTGEKPHACDFCTRRFLSKHDLIVHTRLHTGERPFGCDFCDEFFVANTNLRKHIKSKHKDQLAQK